MDLRALYEEVILDHNRSPRNYPKKPDGCNCSAHGDNPLCGDQVQVHLRVEDGVIEDIGFEGRGCAISTASASLMTEALKGKSEDEAAALFEAVHKLLTEQRSHDSDADADRLDARGLDGQETVCRALGVARDHAVLRPPRNAERP